MHTIFFNDLIILFPVRWTVEIFQIGVNHPDVCRKLLDAIQETHKNKLLTSSAGDYSSKIRLELILKDFCKVSVNWSIENNGKKINNLSSSF